MLQETPIQSFHGMVDVNADRETKTAQVHSWLRSLPDDHKQRFALSWRIPHSIFNAAALFIPSDNLQNIDWYKIHKSRDLGVWSHGGKVYPL